MSRLNRIRTPPKNNDKETKRTSANVSKEKEPSKEEECKLHLAECYLSKRRIDHLTNEIEEKEKQEDILKGKLDEMEFAMKQKENLKTNEVKEYKMLINELMNKLSILENQHDFSELVKYYEGKMQEQIAKNETNVKMYIKMIEKFSNPNNNRDEIWRKAINKLEKKILDLEAEIATIKKFERSVLSRQKFFEKYSSQTEEKIEKFSKLQKKCSILEDILKETQNKVLSLEKESSEAKKENQNLTAKCNEFKEQFNKMSKFFNEIQPILKIEWQDIFAENQKALFLLKSEVQDFSSHNIVKLVDNMKEFLSNYENNVKLSIKSFEVMNLNPIMGIIDDVKKYLIVLLKKVQHLTINQYHMINICCDLNEKVQEHGKRTKDNSFEYLKLLKDLRNTCSKLLYELHPEKVSKRG